jgi:amino acid adenylation domain-containing protein
VTAPDSLVSILERAAGARPDHPAVLDGDVHLTYAELLGRSRRIAATLRESGVRPGDRVGVWLPKSLDAVAALYGVLGAGAAYVPLDPKAPVARSATIAGDAGARVVLTSAKKARDWPAMVEQSGTVEALVVLDRDAIDAVESPVTTRWSDELADDAPLDRVPPDALAYILYTSGSTGQPKGVMLSHRNALAFVDWAVRATKLGPDDRLSSHAPFHFDLSVFDLYASARVGATVALVPHRAMVFPVELARWIAATAITTWYSVPSALTLLVTNAELEAGAFPHLRTVIFAGEVFPTPYLARCMELLPHASFWNWYGPTETNVCTAFLVPSAPDPGDPPVSIGGPIDGVDTIVVDEAGAAVEAGADGELLVSGPTVTCGYWNDAPRTAERLAQLPSRSDDQRVWYRTGDLVVEEDGGTYRFRGRRDHQVKSRGYRIELGEIEAALHRHPDIADATVVAVPDELVTNRLRAFVVATGELSDADLSRHVADLVPPYMVPERFDRLDAMPRTSTGKVDRQALQHRADEA